MFKIDICSYCYLQSTHRWAQYVLEAIFGTQNKQKIGYSTQRWCSGFTHNYWPEEMLCIQQRFLTEVWFSITQSTGSNFQMFNGLKRVMPPPIMLVKTNQIKHLKEGSLYRQEKTNQAGSKDQVDKQMRCRSLAPKVRWLKVIRNTCSSLLKIHLPKPQPRRVC